eukprot:TRINITY_DN7225_c0_g1_i5.p1 TRINITY_DN7225_c0_g1~~TRINITY_DN7225_c0_g1_i5.p1  ORF type:complete len:376 (+),score=78.82 TRINITY_DN7225_c0_g1_i5:342-1469(+)
MVRCKSDQAPDCEGYEYSTNEEDNADLSPYQPVHKPTYNGGMMSPPGSPPPNSLVNGRYQLGSTIGKGNDGTVVRAINVTTGKPLAIKITNRKRHNSESGCTEADNTRRAQSRNVVRVHEVVTRGDLEYLVMELGEMDLLELINALGCLDEDVAREYFRDLIYGLDSCHKVNVVHLDVKPDNLLIIDDGTTNGRVKLTDFGLSAYIGGPKGPVLLCQACGSNGYAPPEILRGTDAYDGRKADVWSSGIVLYACTQGQLPWDDACEDCEEFFDYVQGNFMFPGNMSPGLEALLRKILVVEPNNRATLDDIKNDEWFRQGHQGNLSNSFSSEEGTGSQDIPNHKEDQEDQECMSHSNETASPINMQPSHHHPERKWS